MADSRQSQAVVRKLVAEYFPADSARALASSKTVRKHDESQRSHSEPHDPSSSLSQYR